MNVQPSTEKDENVVEINLSRILEAMLRKVWLILLVTVLSTALVILGTFLWITPQYEASAVFYVNNSALSIGDASLSIESGDISASKSLVNTYIVILKDRVTLTEIIDYAGVDMTYSTLYKNISAQSINDTEVFQVVVTDSSPQDAERIANAVAHILPKRISSIIDGSSVKIVSDAVVPASPSSPSYTKNAMIGFALGLFLSVGFIALRVIFDTTIREHDDITQCCRYPVLAEVPDMAGPTKSGSYYSAAASGKRGKYVSHNPSAKVQLVGPNISFAAAEAYKLLRTKLQFSFADENDSHIIGLSSALSGEGKSLTAVNLAFALSQLDKKVLLVDCDMRRPTLAEKLGLLKYPGLSSYLTRQCQLNDLIQLCQMKGSDCVFHVITAGQNPPNPVELLSSPRMKKALEAMRRAYDYVILDLPPVGEVSDAMAVAKEADGILLVVRQNYCDRNVLTEAVSQFDFLNAKMLGVVYNCTNDGIGKRYYKKYYKRYGKNYSGSNAQSRPAEVPEDPANQ